MIVNLYPITVMVILFLLLFLLVEGGERKEETEAE